MNAEVATGGQVRGFADFDLRCGEGDADTDGDRDAAIGVGLRAGDELLRRVLRLSRKVRLAVDRNIQAIRHARGELDISRTRGDVAIDVDSRRVVHDARAERQFNKADRRNSDGAERAARDRDR